MSFLLPNLSPSLSEGTELVPLSGTGPCLSFPLLKVHNWSTIPLFSFLRPHPLKMPANSSPLCLYSPSSSVWLSASLSLSQTTRPSLVNRMKYVHCPQLPSRMTGQTRANSSITEQKQRNRGEKV